MNRITSHAISFLLLCTIVAVPASAATVTRHATEADFLAALDPALIVFSEQFDGFAAGTVISNQVAGVVFSSPNSGLAGYVPIQTLNLPQAVSMPLVLGGGYVASKTVRQSMVLDFLSPASAVAFYVIAQNPTMREITVELGFTGEAPQTLLVRSADRNNPVEFFGITSDVPIARLTLTSNEESGGLFQSFGGIDNLTFGGSDVLPPICSAVTSRIAGVLGVDGTGTDDRPGDSGIGSVVEGPDTMNMLLTVDPFTPGDPFATFRIEPEPGAVDAQGTIVVSDVAGNSCELCLNFRNLPPGPLFEEVLCCAEGINFFINNPAQTPPGPSFCSASPYGPGEPNLPPGYEPSPENDPFPCQVLTIDSPNTGLTDMIYKKDGLFDPQLRMMASSSPDGGMTFPPFSDVTTEVVPILTIPDPTLLRGQTSWSVVKIACAILAEVCDGVDNDGDGDIDEGLPVGDESVDQDVDGFPLCADDPALSDCEDQNPLINPDGTEICNGLDDNCDGAADENNPGGGVACTVPDLLGVCADGETLCFESEVHCNQTVFASAEACNGLDDDCDGSVPADEADADGDGYRVCGGDCNDGDAAINPGATEVCDGADNDCSGAADDGNPGGGLQCGITDVGVCAFGVTACQAGAVVCAGNVDPIGEICGDGLDNDCDGQTDEQLLPVATCSLSQTNFNVTSESTAFKFSLTGIVNGCDSANPTALDPASIGVSWLSRVGSQVLPDPSTQQCPDPFNGFLGETGIFESIADRQQTGNDLDIKFNGEADGDCRTLDGSRQEVFALLADVVDGASAPICFSSTVNGVVFECCADVRVTNHGNR